MGNAEIALVVVVLIVILLLVLYFTSTLDAYAMPLKVKLFGPQWTFVPMKESKGGASGAIRKDLANNIVGLQAACIADPLCIGFNSATGELKKTLVAPSAYIANGTDPTKGLYVLVAK